MKFKLEKDEQIIYESKMKLKNKLGLGIHILAIISFIYFVKIFMEMGNLVMSIITVLAVYAILQNFSLKTILTNKRLLYRNLLSITHSIDLKKIVSIGLYYFPNGSYFDLADFGLDYLRIKVDGRFFRVWIVVQDGNGFRSSVLNHITYNLEDKKLNQNLVKKDLLYKVRIVR